MKVRLSSLSNVLFGSLLSFSLILLEINFFESICIGLKSLSLLNKKFEKGDILSTPIYLYKLLCKSTYKV